MTIARFTASRGFAVGARPAAWLRPAALLLSLVASPIVAAPYPRTVVDARGIAVTLPQAPRRIVSITPGTTEMLFAIGVGDRVVGDTVYCDYPPAAQKIAKVGDSTPNYEKIVRLRPDLVVVDDVAERGAPAELTRLNIPIFVIHPNTFDAIKTSLTALGKLCAREPDAKAVVATMDKKCDQARAIARVYAGRPPRVLVVVGVDPLWVAGEGTFFDDLVRQAGGVNAAESLRGYAPESKELVLAKPPDIILTDKPDQTALAQDSALGRLEAVRAGRFGDTSGDIYERPGPRLADGLVAVATTLRRLWRGRVAH